MSKLNKLNIVNLISLYNHATNEDKPKINEIIKAKTGIKLRNEEKELFKVLTYVVVLSIVTTLVLIYGFHLTYQYFNN